MPATRYTRDHEWIRPESDSRNTALVGITTHAQAELGDIVHVELPDPARVFSAGSEIAVIDSVKAASEVYAPVSCTVLAVNDKLSGTPELINQDAEGEGWIVRVELASPGELSALMDADGYGKFLADIS